MTFILKFRNVAMFDNVINFISVLSIQL